MTAAEQVTHGERADHPLAPGASTDAIREALLPTDRAQLDRDLSAAAHSDHPDAVYEATEHWRHVAIVQADRDAFRRLVRRAAEANTGQVSADDEPLEVTRFKAGM